MTTPHPTDLLHLAPGNALDGVASPVNELLEAFLTSRSEELTDLDPALSPVGGAVRDLVRAGGKRIRPAFVWWGYRAADAGVDPEVLKPAAAVELLHTFALIHDDIMDRSATRRGLPAVHTALSEHHAKTGLSGDDEWFGVGGAILTGDLVFVWADMLFEQARMSDAAMRRARLVFTQLRAEVMAGQYLDLRLSGDRGATEGDSLRVSLLKSGRYTVTRPLQMGAALGGSDPALDRSLSTFGDALGVAFQLRDDTLGLLGDPKTTGKGALEDVREGKRTLLVLRARALAAPPQRDLLDRVIGNPAATPEDVERVRQIVTESGAEDDVEHRVATLRAEAERAAEHFPEPARSALLELVAVAVERRK